MLLATIYAGVDQALTALGEVRAQAIAEGDGPYVATAKRLLADEVNIRARLLGGRVLCLCLATVLASTATFEVGGIVPALAAGLLVAFVYGLMIEVLAVLARKYASRLAMPLLRVSFPLQLLVWPWSLPLQWIGASLGKVMPSLKDADAHRIVDMEVENAIERGEEAGAIQSEHAELIRGVLEFKDTIAREIMVPRTQMIAIEVDTPVGEILALIRRSGHSRYPVYRDRADKVIGILYAKDLFRALDQSKGDLSTIDVQRLLRKPVFFVAETQKIGALLKEMQQKRVHLAVVVDEYGGTAGICTLEDILEEIVGEIEDEHDGDEARISELSPGRFIVDASLSIYDLEDALGVELPENDGSYDSVGGLVVEKAGRVPLSGESVVVGDLEMIVREADRRRVRRVEVTKRTATPDELVS